MSKKKKKILTITSAIVTIGIAIFLLMNRTNLVDDGLPAIFVSETTASAGGEVSVNISVRNNPGLAGFILEVDYDEQMLTPIELVRGEVIQQGLFDSNLTAKERTDSIKVVWFDVSDIDEDGELYSIKFKVAGDGTGRTPITIASEGGNISNQELEFVDFKLIGTDIRIAR